MPRKLRIEYSGAIYHVMNRGDRHEDIFKDEADRERLQMCSWTYVSNLLRETK